MALLLLGVALRIASLIPKLKSANHAAAPSLDATGAAVLAVQSGTDAHGPVERTPGVRPAVVEHEELETGEEHLPRRRGARADRAGFGATLKAKLDSIK